MRRKGLATLTALIIAAILLIAGGGYYYLHVMPKKGWKIISGCVAKDGDEIKYQFLGKKDWQLLTENMGCGKDWTDAETFGLKNYVIDDRETDISQTTVLLFDTKPDSYNEKVFEYFSVPKKDNLFLELGRINLVSGDKSVGISDKDWDYLKKSFRFK